MSLAGRARVLVPLCGKAEDLAYLAARGHAVVGVELVEDAVRSFFDEHGIAPEVTRTGEHAVYRDPTGAITILAGDFFTVTPALAGPLDALYDRAALVALSAELRPRYAAHVHALVAPGAPGLVITLEYPQAQAPGPPFSVPEAEVRTLFRDPRLLSEAPDGRVPGRTSMERCWLVRT